MSCELALGIRELTPSEALALNPPFDVAAYGGASEIIVTGKPPYSLARRLHRLSFLIHCILHDIKPEDTPAVSAKEALRNNIHILETRDQLIDDIVGLSEDQRRQGWEKLDIAMRSCGRDGFTDENLKALLDAVAAFSKGMLRWVAKLKMDGEQKIFALQMP